MNFEELKGLNYGKIKIIGFNIFKEASENESLQINLKKYKVKLQKLDPVREVHSYVISFEYKECPDYKLWIFVNDTETLEILQKAWFLSKEDIKIHRSWLEEFRKNKGDVDILDWLYLNAPIRIMRFVGINQMLNDLTSLLGHSVDTFGTDEETAVTRLLQALYKEIEFFENYEKQQGRSSKNHNDEFLNQLISSKYMNTFAEFKNGDGREVDLNLLESLSVRLDGDNYKAFLQFIWSIWKNSTYAIFDPVLNPYINPSKNNKGVDTIGPMSLGYRSNKSMGFHTDNAEIERIGGNKIKVDINIKTGVFDHIEVDLYGVDGGSATLSTEREINHIYMYHYFSPISISKAENPTFIFEDKDQKEQTFTFLPAFILLEREKKAFWENIVVGAEYTVDLITSLSGFANILKVGRLAKILKAGHSLRYKTKAATNTLKGVKAFAGAIEISSGVGNILIKLLGFKDSELGKAISKYLFYFEMLSLSGELTFALDVALKKSAKEVLDKVNDSKKGLDGIVIDDNGAKRKLSDTEIEEVVEYLEEVSELKAKKRTQFKEFLKKWEGKSIVNLTRKEIADNLKGFTEQANKVAKIVEDGVFEFSILNEKAFKKKYLDIGGEEADYTKFKIEAFSYGDENFFRSTKSVGEFMSELVHEGTHTLDYLKKEALIESAKTLKGTDRLNKLKNIYKQFGDNHSYEKRAYFHERAFQEATGLETEYTSIEDMIDHIKYSYKKN
ncbi:hypothetical protein [Psychroserpens algicola]|uniref:hypothetical protein n=1 Tax=Psychroserpens algicola TaxID=1719034 RepID=UPI0019542913|nr:hypothetical protein [Psychroserpens algicola]